MNSEIPANTDRPYDVLLLDFGGVCLFSPFEIWNRLERKVGLAIDSVSFRGPFDLSADHEFQKVHDGVMTEREYWEFRSASVGALAGLEWGTNDLMDAMYNPPGPDLIRPEMADVVDRAQKAGISVSVLTNDLSAFHDQEWIAGMEFLDQIDHLVDLSHLGVLKPDPRAYQHAIEAIDTPADRILFVDDQPINVEGAVKFGIDTVHLDLTAASVGCDEVAERLRL